MKRMYALLLIPVLITAIGCESKKTEVVSNATDYSLSEHWLSLPATIKPVDVFYVYPTAWQKTAANEPNINAIDNASMLKGSNAAFARQATAFETVGNVYAPYYRQADAAYTLTLPTLEEREHVIAGEPALDITAAFDYYIQHFNDGRPFILAGHSQGSNVLLYLLADYMKEHPDVYGRMVAAYVIGYSVTEAYLANNPHLKFAVGPDDTRVIVSYNTQSPSVAKGVNPVVLDGAIAINPITWKRDETPAMASQGSGSFLPFAGVLSEVPQYADATVDLDKGVILCSTADEIAMHGLSPTFPIGVYHSFDYLFYYYNLRANAAERVAKYLAAHKE